MGLDQYAYVLDGDSREEFCYWRKHNRLHGSDIGWGDWCSVDCQKAWSRKRFPWRHGGDSDGSGACSPREEEGE